MTMVNFAEVLQVSCPSPVQPTCSRKYIQTDFLVFLLKQ